jgi:hypothetical protein
MLRPSSQYELLTGTIVTRAAKIALLYRNEPLACSWDLIQTYGVLLFIVFTNLHNFKVSLSNFKIHVIA